MLTADVALTGPDPRLASEEQEWDSVPSDPDFPFYLALPIPAPFPLLPSLYSFPGEAFALHLSFRFSRPSVPNQVGKQSGKEKKRREVKGQALCATVSTLEQRLYSLPPAPCLDSPVLTTSFPNCP